MGSVQITTYVDDYDKEEIAEGTEVESAVLEWNGVRRKVTTTSANFKKLDEQLSKILETADQVPTTRVGRGQTESMHDWLSARGITEEQVRQFERDTPGLSEGQRGIKVETRKKWDELNG